MKIQQKNKKSTPKKMSTIIGNDGKKPVIVRNNAKKGKVVLHPGKNMIVEKEEAEILKDKFSSIVFLDKGRKDDGLLNNDK